MLKQNAQRCLHRRGLLFLGRGIHRLRSARLFWLVQQFDQQRVAVRCRAKIRVFIFASAARHRRVVADRAFTRRVRRLDRHLLAGDRLELRLHVADQGRPRIRQPLPREILLG